MAEVPSKKESVTIPSSSLKDVTLAEDGSITDQNCSAKVSLSDGIYNQLEGSIELVKSTEEICKNNSCFEFKTIQNPTLQLVYLAKPGPIVEEDAGEELYLRQLKQQKLIPSKRILNCLKGPSIALQYYNLDCRQTRSLCEAMLINETVDELNLSCNKLTLDSLYHLGQLIRKSKILKSLTLQHCRVGPEGVELLANGMEVCHSLSNLDLSYNEIGDDGMNSFCVKLKYNATINKLNLSHNNLTHESGFALSETMEENMGLHDLDLSWNQINGEPGLKKFLFMAAEVNENLMKLDLSWNGLGGDKIANVFKHFIANQKTLTELNLSHNRFETTADLIKLAKGINASESLQDINLSYNGITADAGFSLLSNINPKASLRTLQIKNLWVKQDFEKLRRELKMQSGLEVIIEGVSGGADIKGPDMKTLLLKRAHYHGYKPNKNKKDFGWFLLKLKKAGNLEPIKKTKFIMLLQEDQIKFDEGMVDELAKRFRIEDKKVDLNLMLDKYLELFPNTVLPKPKETKKSKPSKKGKTTTESPRGSIGSKTLSTEKGKSPRGSIGSKRLSTEKGKSPRGSIGSNRLSTEKGKSPRGSIGSKRLSTEKGKSPRGSIGSNRISTEKGKSPRGSIGSKRLSTEKGKSPRGSIGSNKLSTERGNPTVKKSTLIETATTERKDTHHSQLEMNKESQDNLIANEEELGIHSI